LNNNKKKPTTGPKLKYLGYALIIITILSTVVGLIAYKPWVKSTQVIRVGVLKITPSLRYWIAEEKGFFEKYGLSVEIRDDYFSTNDIANDVANGTIDVGHFAASTVFQAWSIEPEKMYIFTLDLNTSENHIDNLLLSAESSIVRIDELRGEPIGKFPGEQATIIIKSYLESQGFTEDEMILIDIAPQSQIEALNENQVRALFAYEPIGATLALDFDSPILVGGVTTHILNPFPGGAGVFSSKFISARPDDAKLFIQAIREATDYVNDPNNFLEVCRILSDRLSIRFDVAKRTQWLVWNTMEEIDIMNLQDYADFQFSHGQLTIPIKVEDLIYNEP
jgi:NitT/TauT family transport system substrate-binding protein